MRHRAQDLLSPIAQRQMFEQCLQARLILHIENILELGDLIGREFHSITIDKSVNLFFWTAAHAFNENIVIIKDRWNNLFVRPALKYRTDRPFQNTPASRGASDDDLCSGRYLGIGFHLVTRCALSALHSLRSSITRCALSALHSLRSSVTRCALSALHSLRSSITRCALSALHSLRSSVTCCAL